MLSDASFLASNNDNNMYTKLVVWSDVGGTNVGSLNGYDGTTLALVVLWWH